MTFEEWYENNEQQIDDGIYELKDIWNIAQQNYPFVICDEQMEDTLFADVKEQEDLTDEEAGEFIEEYCGYIVDNMWDGYSNALEYSINHFKR